MALDAAKFEAVTVQMDRMVVGAAIFEEQAIALAGGEGRALSVGIGLAVDEPVVEVAVTGKFGFEDERDLDGFGFGRRRGVGELEIVPVEAGWLLPLRLAAAACVFDDDAHTSGLDALADFAESPDAGIVHLDDGADTLGRREAKHWYGLGLGYGVAIQCDDSELMPGEGDPVRFGGAGVHDVEQDALSLLDAQGFTKAQGAAVDGGDLVGGIHGAVVACQQAAVPVVEGDEELLIVGCGIMARFDVQKAVLAGVLGFLEIAACKGVGVVPAEPRGAGREGVTGDVAWGDVGCALLHGAVDRR